MTNKYEQRYLTDLAFRVAHSFPARSVVAQELSSWVEGHDLGFAWDPDVNKFRGKGVPAAVWSDLQKLLAVRNASVARPRPDMLADNIALLSGHVGLTSEEHFIFELAVRAARNGPVRAFRVAVDPPVFDDFPRFADTSKPMQV